jgi:hypothetical protein
MKMGDENFSADSESIGEVVSRLENKDLSESLSLLNSHGFSKFASKVNVGSGKELEEFVKQEMKEFFKNKLDNMKQKLTEFRKAGLDAHLETIDIMPIPLKVRLFISTCKKSDLEKLMKMVDSEEKAIMELDKLKQKLEAELEKIRAEKEAEEERVKKEKEEKDKKKNSEEMEEEAKREDRKKNILDKVKSSEEKAVSEKGEAVKVEEKGEAN